MAPEPQGVVVNPSDPQVKACPYIQSNTGPLLEYSVVYTDRAINLMAPTFVQTMQQIIALLKSIFEASHVALIPGSGTYAMESVARQFATGKKAMVIRNGYFSFRWSDIFECCGIPEQEVVLKARVMEEGRKPQMKPVEVDEVVRRIKEERPAVIFAPHVETSTGIILPHEYIKAVADAIHEVGGIFVLDCVAGGSIWPRMNELGVDVVVTAPQKGLSGPACVGIAMLNDRAKKVCDESKPTSFCCNLPKWINVCEAYEKGGFMYYTTLPTDSIQAWLEVMKETEAVLGFDKAQENAKILGKLVRDGFKQRGFKSVAPEGFEAPTVVVVYADAADMVPRFKAEGVQVAGPVPFKCDEPEGLSTFRIGLFGLDKLKNPEKCAALLFDKLDKVMAATK